MKNKPHFIAFLFVILSILACGGGTPGTGYEIKGDQVYYSSDGQSTDLSRDDAIVELIPEADASSFQILDQFVYAKDAKHVFLRGYPLDGPDPATFKVISVDPPYSSDSQRVYYGENLIAGAQPDSFQILGSTGIYARDSKQVYFYGNSIGAQPESFKVLYEFREYSYSADSTNVYFGYAVITGADPQTFQVLSDGYVAYSKDAKQVYFSENVLLGSDVATFEVLSDGFAKDAKQVYWEDEIIDGADPATFKVQDGIGSDKNGCYNSLGLKTDC